MVRFTSALVTAVLLIGVGGAQQQANEIRESPTDQKLRLALGEKCPELERPIRIFLLKSKILLATRQFNIEESNKREVKLIPCTFVRFQAAKGEGKPPVDIVLRSDWALLKLDRPINNAFEIGDARLLSLELANGVKLTFPEPQP